MIIGITGPSGAGKSTVTEYLACKYGYFVIDADKIARDVTVKGSKALDEIAATFGVSYITNDGELDRRKLGELVFSQKDQLDKLNKITHKYILEKIEFLAKCHNNAIIDAPLLFETGLDLICDKIILVLCDTQKRIERIMKRDSLTYKQAEERIKSQKNYEEYISKCQIIINDGRDIHKQLTEVKNW